MKRVDIHKILCLTNQSLKPGWTSSQTLKQKAVTVTVLNLRIWNMLLIFATNPGFSSYLFFFFLRESEIIFCVWVKDQWNALSILNVGYWLDKIEHSLRTKLVSCRNPTIQIFNHVVCEHAKRLCRGLCSECLTSFVEKICQKTQHLNAYTACCWKSDTHLDFWFTHAGILCSVSHAPFLSSCLYSVILFLLCKTSQLVFILIALPSRVFVYQNTTHCKLYY